MRWLDHRIPPPLVGAIVALAMWQTSSFGSPLPLPEMARNTVAAVLGVAGLGFDLAGLLAFRARRTTVNPLKPQRASSLVTAGVYGLTRNPMYVGMLCLLSGWAVFLAMPWPLCGPVVFAAYITRFQIQPEERALLKLFGQEYQHYTTRVRRWL